MKKQSEKNSPNYLIAKLLLNTLSPEGRFGMNPCLAKHEIILERNEFSGEFVQKYDVSSILHLNNGLRPGGRELISYTQPNGDSRNYTHFLRRYQWE